MSTQKPQDDNRKQLQALLRDLFQFDAADLDFGVYRILNQRRDRIEQFIEDDLLDAVDESLESLADAKRAEIEEQLEEKREDLIDEVEGDNIFNADGSLTDEYAGLPLNTVNEYQELWETREDVAIAEETEARIFNDLYRFFSRYYEDGDFHTKRRISSKDSKYYVPYNGEETYFHWANNDQYYVKTGEHFTDYRFDAGEWTVEFRLEEADVPQDNVKGDNRYFVLGRGDPVSTDADEQTVTIQFQYRQITEDEADDYIEAYNEATGSSQKQFPRRVEKRCEALEGRIIGYVEDAGAERILTAEKEDDAISTVLKNHLNRYVSENTMDYFVHKDLQKFLEGELEFFLQNEVLDVEEIIKSDDGSSPPVLRARTVRDIGERIISFLAQIEDFQKRLFEKKKFVTQTDYMVTLDKISNYLYEAILENEEQLKQWHDVYNTDEWRGDLSWQGEFTEAVLNDNPHLMIDTALFDDAFKRELLTSFEDIEEATDGILIHGENFQGTNLIKEKFRGVVDCAYVDPPYNTDSSPILYKNNYKNSSWISLIHDRIGLLRTLLAEQGILSFAIDDEQLAEARLLLGKMFDKEVGFAVVRSNPQSRKTRGKFSPNHEYALFYGQTSKAKPGTLGPSEQKLERYPYEDEEGRYAWMNFIRTGSNDLREDRPKLYYPIIVDGDDELRIPEMSWSSQRGEYVIEESISSDEQVVYPVVEDGGQVTEKNWQRGPDRVQKEPNEYRVRRDRDNEINIDFKTRMDAEAPPTTWWDDNEYASANYGALELKRLFGSKPFDFPKATKLVEDSIRAAGGNTGKWVLDPFAGSGTTASAVARINREEEDNLKYILIEMGDHFDTVIRPRIQKLALSLEWDDGVPVERDGQTHLVKYHRLESYEDALNNIALSESSGPLQEYLEEEVDDYTSGYLLDFESRESVSLLPEGTFKEPFNYELKIEQNGTSRESTTVDLVETFHYLIGADVRKYWHETHQDRKYVVTECEVDTESGVETVLTAWRRMEDIDYDEEQEWFDDKFESESYDRVYVNAESQIAQSEPLEITFREKMEEGPNVA